MTGTLELIFQLLKEQHKTQKSLCEHIGIESSSVTQWKTGETTSYMQHIVKIADFLGVSTDYLLGVSQEKINENILTQRELNMISKFRRLSYQRQENVIRTIDLMNEPLDKC
jgi:transcriptional regulator with XRE-family HTH domain